MLKEKMIAVISAVNEEVAERRELINMIAVCLLTRKNLFILGDTGAAKSYAINRFRRRGFIDSIFCMCYNNRRKHNTYPLQKRSFGLSRRCFR